MLQTRIIPHAVHLKTAAGVDAWINQIETLSPDSAVALLEETSGSETDRAFVAAAEISPTLPIVTSDLTILGTVGFAGLFIAPDSGKPGAIAFGRELPAGGLPTALGTAAHLSLTISDGLLVPVRITAGHNSPAKLMLMIHGTLGNTATFSSATPFVYAAGQSITTGAGPTSNLFSAGPVRWTTTGSTNRLLQGIKQIGVDFGIRPLIEGSDSEVYPSHCSIMSRMPRIEFSTADAAAIAEIGDGVAIGAAAAYFVNWAQDGARVAAATATHVKISGTAGVITPGSVNLTHKRPGESRFIYTPRFNTATITISTTLAIPTS